MGTILIRHADEDRLNRTLAGLIRALENARMDYHVESTGPSSDEPRYLVTVRGRAAKSAPRIPKTAGEGVDIVGSNATCVSIDDRPTEVRNWRGALITLAERVISAGKVDEIPETWIKDEPSRTVSPISGGRFLYTNLTAEQMLPRMKRLATILGGEVTVSYERDGEPLALSLHRAT